MRARYAKKLHNRDQVEVRVEPGQWVVRHVLGNPRVVEDREHLQGGVFVTTLSEDGSIQGNIRHTDLR
jgi:hypothetical protein